MSGASEQAAEATLRAGLSSPWSAARLERQLDRLVNRWRRADGVYATSFRGADCVDDTPLVSDLGDVAPFLAALGRADSALEQARLCQRFLRRGLFLWNGRVRLFENHDFLLGLTELYPLVEADWLLTMATRAVRTLIDEFERNGLLIDVRPSQGLWRLIPRANPFNGGFIEVCVDLHALTGEDWLLDTASRWAHAWVGTPYFRRVGLFCRFNTPRTPHVGALASRFSRWGPVRLFKDNTNLVWALSALFGATGEPALRDAITRFLEGFRRHLLHGGRVAQRLSATGFDVFASWSALDLLCDLAHLEIEREWALDCARAIAADCLSRQWEDGRFPTTEDGQRDHLDVNTDLGVGLWKLYELTGARGYAESAHRAWAANLEAHETAGGLVLSVNRDGDVLDDRIVVKYQALALKTALIWTHEREIYADHQLWSLLRDR